jgi:tetratricopeptide (TPR) repeat protein
LHTQFALSLVLRDLLTDWRSATKFAVCRFLDEIVLMLTAEPPTTSASRYTPTMLAELVGVPVSRVRSWQRRGWIVPVEQKHRLALFDFEEVTAARQLATLNRLGASSRLISKKLKEIQQRFPDVRRPLSELTLILDGRTLLVRRTGSLVELGGQLRIDFDAFDDADISETPATLPSAALFLSRQSTSSEQASVANLATWAADLDEAGDLRSAAEMYRAALAAGGPHAELCFHLAEVLYRLGDLPAARERYFQALEIDENYVEARANLGCVLLDLDEHELAISAFNGALASLESYADVHFHLAKTLDQLNRHAEAGQHWHRFVELAPDSPWADEAHERLSR